MERKKVYLLSSYHFSKNALINIAFELEKILDVRIGLIETLVRRSETPGYFYDSCSPDLAELEGEAYNEWLGLLKQAFPLTETVKEKRGAIEKLLRECYETPENNGIMDLEEDQRLNESENVFVTLLYLGLEGHRIEYKPTEHPNYREMPINERDAVIYENVKQFGNKENILFIGQAHPLSEFDSEELDTYRLEIRNLGSKLLVYGTLPSKFKKMMKDFALRYNGTHRDVNLDFQINYLD